MKKRKQEWNSSESTVPGVGRKAEKTVAEMGKKGAKKKPTNALSAAAEQGISIVEKEWIEDGNQLGRNANPAYISFEKNAESAATRTITMASDCLGPRGDEKSGARKEWLTFCSLKDIQSKFSSYRSNRFNNLFQNATAVPHHRQHVPIFLNEYVSHSNLKLKSIFEDMSDKRVISNIAALAFDEQLKEILGVS
ncbi:PiggyBac transposable element-derived protein 4-like [Plakobranchus ocellatus]|uniref:PiggyBac transposable element-derived protein 4-like n=1 Tax=Plakobranchus ocellatus TaxID=259542 RepID=A0AAV3YEQ5_9GAST|nr:PiggyBac transposable element-derived protein 4-like [Plakobranchus ocellatus]